jgi:hypothetical protein
MNVSFDSALQLRRRSVWEAADSGILLWRHSFAYFIPFFAIPVWITACALLLLPDNFYFLSYLLLWWLKPLFGRLVLHVISRRFFGSPAPSRLGELCRGLWGTMLRGLIGDLSWRRFSPARAAAMPIRVLEHIGPQQIRLRKKALVPGGLNFCTFLTTFGLCLEAMLLAGESMFTVLMMNMFPALSNLEYNIEIIKILFFIAFCFNYILVESLYVCMGFGLYINSRVEVEGWDLQILFNKFSERKY